MKKTILAATMGLIGLSASFAAAETCGGTYKVRPGDSLSLIADTQYKNAGMWTTIHSNNLSVIGPKPNALRVGMRLSLACLNGLPAGLEGGTELSEATPVVAKPVEIVSGNAAVRQRINLLTATDYAPFTDKNSHNGGLLYEVVQAAMDRAAPSKGFAIHWVDDWGSHFDPLLSNALLDMGFPWYKPDCASTPDENRCKNFFFSEPMFETLILLFVDKNRGFAFENESDIYGKTLCRPNGYFTHDLNKNGRNWLTDGKVKLEQPRTVKDCFDMVQSGEVDAVAMNEFTGRTAIKEHDLGDKIRVLPQPLSIEGLHVIVHKTHPQAQSMLAEINAGLKGIRENGTYQRIIEDHMARIWANF